MPPLWYLLAFPDPPPPPYYCTETAASYSSTSSSSSRVVSAVSTVAMDKITKQCSKVSSFPEIEIHADLIIHVGDSVFPLHKAVMMPKCSYIRRAVAAAVANSKADDNADGDGDPKAAATVVELDLSSLPGGADAFEKVARYCYGANFEITPANAAALRCAAAFLDMRHPSADLARRVDEFLARSAFRNLPDAVAVLRSCDAPPADDLLRAAAEELGVARRAADAVALAVCREALFPTASRAHGWWKAELAVLPPRSFAKVVTALRCRRADTAVVAAAAGSYAELALAEVLAAPRDCAEQRALLEAVVDALPSPADAPGIPAPLLCRLLHAAVATEASAKACRDLELRVAAVLDQATAEDLLGVALGGAGERVRHADTVRRVVAAFVERHADTVPVPVPRESSERRRSRRASMSVTEVGAAGTARALEKVARMVDEVAAEMATEEALPIAKFVGVAGAVPRDARASHDALYRAVDIYLKTHPALDEIQREKVCSVMDPLKLSYQARLHASQNKRLPLQAALSALYYDQLKLRSADAAAVTSMRDVPVADTRSSTSAAAAGRHRAAQAMADASLARENEALRMELARMRAYMSGMQVQVQHQHGGKGSGGGGGGGWTTPASPAPSWKTARASFLGPEPLARMRAYVSGMHMQHGGGKGSASTPASPARSAAAAKAKASFLGSVSRSLSRLNPFRGGGGWAAKHAAGGIAVAAGGSQCKTMQHHHVVTPKKRRSSIG